MKILVTGIAGFIGFHLVKRLVANDHEVVGIDNINDYYDINLKYRRLDELGLRKEKVSMFNTMTKSETHPDSLKFIRMNLEDRGELPKLFQEEKFDVVCNLAAQAGVRHSIENPEVYVDSNIIGFLNILECCRHNSIKHLVYASSSSVYGLNAKVPFETTEDVSRPISLYAATKKSNELMAHTYSHLYGFHTTGLRFFTVYGPWGRPDMAMFLFVDAILKDNPIKVFNNGHVKRDFTFIDDIVEGVVRVIEDTLAKRKNDSETYKVYNIGNNKSVELLDFIVAIEKNLGVKAKKEMLPKQPGDVDATWANIDPLIEDYNYRPRTSIEKGVKSFIQWYKDYYNIENPE